MSPRLRSFALALFLSGAGCQTPTTSVCWDPDGEAFCPGTLAVDPALDPPAFGLDGPLRRRPDSLWVFSDADCRSWQRKAWRLEDIPPSAFPIRYGEVPAGAREPLAPLQLEAGTTYRVSFSMRLDRGATESTLGWSGFFVAGEPDSFELEEERCDF